MARKKKMTTYVDEDLLRSAKVVAARTDRKVYEVFEEALKNYLLGSSELPEDVESRAGGTDLRDLLAGDGSKERPLPGAPDEEAEELSGGATLSDAVLAEREERGY